MSVNAEEASNTSTSTFLSSLSFSCAILAIEITAFAVLKNTKHLRRIYAPRSFLIPPRQRFEATSGFLRWIPGITLRTDKRDLIAKNDLDSCLIIRFLELCILLFAGLVLICTAILMPINAVGVDGGGTANGLNRFQFGNVAPTQHQRYIAHLVCAWALTAFTVFLIRRELRAFVPIRHEYLASPARARLTKARTVLLTGVPEELLTEEAIHAFCHFVPDGVARVWIHREFKSLLELHKKRVKLCDTLEAAESKMVRISVKADVKAAKQEKDTERLQAPLWRPKHSESFLPFIGRKVDSVDMYKIEIDHLNRELEEDRKRDSKPLPTVFIECNTQVGALVLVQVAPYHQPSKMQGRYLDADPDDLIWSNLDDNPVELTGRKWLTRLVAAGVSFAYSFVPAFIGGISNVSALCSQWSFLAWLCDLPTPVPGIIQGILPPTLLAIAFILLPIILRALAVYAGAPTHTIAERRCSRPFSSLRCGSASWSSPSRRV